MVVGVIGVFPLTFQFGIVGFLGALVFVLLAAFAK